MSENIIEKWLPRIDDDLRKKVAPQISRVADETSLQNILKIMEYTTPKTILHDEKSFMEYFNKAASIRSNLFQT